MVIENTYFMELLFSQYSMLMLGTARTDACAECFIEMRDILMLPYKHSGHQKCCMIKELVVWGLKTVHLQHNTKSNTFW